MLEFVEAMDRGLDDKRSIDIRMDTIRVSNLWKVSKELEYWKLALDSTRFWSVKEFGRLHRIVQQLEGISSSNLVPFLRSTDSPYN